MAINKKIARRQKIKSRTRSQVFGDANRPRLCVFRSNKEIYAQIVDDAQSHTLFAASSREEDIAKNTITRLEEAKIVGKRIAERAVAAGIKSVVFDRNGYLYHGRVKNLADAAREGGLEF